MLTLSPDFQSPREVFLFGTRLALVLALVLGMISTALAQTRISYPWDGFSDSRSSAMEAESVDPTFRTALEEPVDRNIYRLVPGDRLTIGIWGERPENHELAVTPEGDIRVPQAGPEKVAGQSLAEAEQIVRARLRKLYPGSRITLGLLEPGRFRVAVTGRVAVPGWYDLTGLDRMSTALEAAGGIGPGGSHRFVRIHLPEDAPIADRTPVQAGPNSFAVDFLPWLSRADLAANPRLEPGWRIEVPPLGETVTVIGAVNGHGGPREDVEDIVLRFGEEELHPVEWRPGDTVAYALEVAGGLAASAAGALDIVRADGTSLRLDATRETDLQTELAVSDRLEVAYREQWIYVVGAVRRPGRYPQYPGYNATDYVLMAGGETENGSREGWTITLPGETEASEQLDLRIEPGSTLRVPERRSYWLTRVITPVASAVAVGISVAALLR